jgi:flagellar biosynthesis/type III secretory pathway protein FliH
MAEIHQSRLLKGDMAQEFQSWTTSLATLNEEFSPFFSLTSPSQNAPDPNNFDQDEIHVISQNQARSDNWEAMAVEGFDSNAGAAAEGAGGLSAEEMMIQQQMAMMAEAAGGEFNFDPAAAAGNGDTSADDDDDLFDDGFGDTEVAAPIPEITEEEAFTEARERGYNEGYQAGLEAGKAEGLPQGIANGEVQAQQQMEAVLSHELTKLAQAEVALQEMTNMLGEAMFEPVKRLALHMAKELVRGELTQSDEVVTRLVKGCMEQLEISKDKLQVYLNSDDYQLLQADSMLEGKVSYLPSADLTPGSVRVEQADSWVDDLLEDRLIMLSNQALGSVDDRLMNDVGHLTEDEQKVLAGESVELPQQEVQQEQFTAESEAEVVAEQAPVIEPEVEDDALFADQEDDSEVFFDEPAEQSEQVEAATEAEQPEAVADDAEMTMEELQAQLQAPAEGVESADDWADLAAIGDALDGDAAEDDDDDELF